MKYLITLASGILTLYCCLISLTILKPHAVLAHPGRTDSSGGHTCRTNCESWGLEYGEYHYHNGTGSGSGGLSEAAQARIAGAEFANKENRTRIESSANAEGNSQGNIDGLDGENLIYADNDSAQHCSQEINFTSTTSVAYREAFQTVYTRTCIQVYEDEYRAAYEAANLAAQKVYEENKTEQEAGSQQTSDSNEENTGDIWIWLIVGGFVGLPILAAGWESIKEMFN